MKCPFKVGERVVVYNAGERFIATISYVNINNTFVQVGSATPFHTKQCRRLVKKKRRELFVHESCAVVRDSACPCNKSKGGEKWIRFVEARGEKG